MHSARALQLGGAEAGKAQGSARAGGGQQEELDLLRSPEEARLLCQQAEVQFQLCELTGSETRLYPSPKRKATVT